MLKYYLGKISPGAENFLPDEVIQAFKGCGGNKLIDILQRNNEELRTLNPLKTKCEIQRAFLVFYKEL